MSYESELDTRIALANRTRAHETNVPQLSADRKRVIREQALEAFGEHLFEQFEPMGHEFNPQKGKQSFRRLFEKRDSELEQLKKDVIELRSLCAPRRKIFGVL